MLRHNFIHKHKTNETKFLKILETSIGQTKRTRESPVGSPGIPMGESSSPDLTRRGMWPGKEGIHILPNVVLCPWGMRGARCAKVRL